MVLVYSQFNPRDPDTRARNARAMESWVASGIRLLPFQSDQNSSKIGDPHALHFVKDMIWSALESGDDDVAIISNNDIILKPEAPEVIQRHCDEFGGFWCHRTDENGHADGGIDLMAFSRWWWTLNSDSGPDLLLGCRWWDKCWQMLLVKSGVPEGKRICIHIPHGNDHRQRLSTPGARYNEHAGSIWAAQNQV